MDRQIHSIFQKDIIINYFSYGIMLFFIFFVPLVLSFALINPYPLMLFYVARLALLPAIFFALNGALGKFVLEKSTKKWFIFPNYIWILLFISIIMSFIIYIFYPQYLLLYQILSRPFIHNFILRIIGLIMIIYVLGYIELLIIKWQTTNQKNPFFYLFIFSLVFVALFWIMALGSLIWDTWSFWMVFQST